MRISAMGDGFNGVYTARNFSNGWGFIKNDGTWLTTGIGTTKLLGGKTVTIGIASPVTRSTLEEMLAAIQAARPRVKIVEIEEEDE